MKTLTAKISGNEIRQSVDDAVSDFSAPSEVVNSWAENFILKKEEGSTKGLRNPQVGAYHSIISHWTFTNQIGTVVLPTGTGKTETMLSVFVSERLAKLLVIVPSVYIPIHLTPSFRTYLTPLFRRFDPPGC